MSSPELGRVIVESLFRYGIHEVVLCPGSRSTSIALALAASPHPLHLHMRTDERVGAFLALGLAKAVGAAAIVVTSGTAVGELLPAIMEARHSGIPLVVITADRPATLVGMGANQTTWQQGIFSRHAVHEAQLTSTDAAPRAWAAALGHAIIAAKGLRTRTPGPVHINASFTEPFADPQPALGMSADDASGWPTLPAIQVQATPSAPPVSMDGEGTVVVVGDAPREVGERARQIAERGGCPLFAEPSSNARGGDHAITGYTQLLSDPDLAASIQQVIVAGHPTLSRPISRLLSRTDIPIVALSHTAQWPNPGHQVTQVVDDLELTPASPQWLETWKRADARLETAAHDQPATTLPAATVGYPASSSDDQPAACQSAECQSAATPPAAAPRHPAASPGEPTPPDDQGLSGPMIARAVVESAHSHLFFGSSSAIRDADRGPIIPDGTHTWANRGLAGIDGTLATATGIALATCEPITVLLGDLSFLYDISALHQPPGVQVDMRVVVMDDDGGSIFSGLEVGESPYCRDYFCMPQGADLARMARGFTDSVTAIATADQLRAALAAPIDGMEVIIASITKPRHR